MKVFIILTILATSQAVPLPQYDYPGEEEFAAEEGAERIGSLLKKLPSLLSKTANWIQELGTIGDDIHPEVGDAIRTGAQYVNESSLSVPNDLHKRLEMHINSLVNLTKEIQGDVKEAFNSVPDLVGQLDGIPGEEYIRDAASYIPSGEEVEGYINEAVNYIEPLADAIGSKNTNNTITSR